MADPLRTSLSEIVAGTYGFNLPEFIAELQSFSLGLRLQHWSTKSFALHKAAEQTQGSIDELTDDFVEAYVGLTGGIRPEFSASITSSYDEDAMIKCLRGLTLSDSSLLNIRDEMLQTVYKYKYLKTLS